MINTVTGIALICYHCYQPVTGCLGSDKDKLMERKGIYLATRYKGC